jgi:5-formyltetrahydrofolate cyclo-ligase
VESQCILVARWPAGVGGFPPALGGTRRALTREEIDDVGSKVANGLVSFEPLRRASTVALYSALPFEVPTTPVIRLVQALGICVVLPRVQRGSKVLRFHSITPNSEFAVGPFGILEPREDSRTAAAISAIDVFIVPAVALAPDGTRLGSGGGYYDATLAGRRATSLAVGLAFGCCLTDALPREAHDQQMDSVATELGLSPRR